MTIVWRSLQYVPAHREKHVTSSDGELYNPDFQLLAKSFGIKSALIEEPSDLEAGVRAAMAERGPFLLEVRTRGDVPMPRTGYWDIADFLATGND